MASGSSRASRKQTFQRLEVTGDLDAQSVEALSLEIRQLALRCGIPPEDVRVEVVDRPEAVDQPTVRSPRRARPRSR